MMHALCEISWSVLFFTNTILQAAIFIVLSLTFRNKFITEWNTTDLSTLLKYAVVLVFLGIAETRLR